MVAPALKQVANIDRRYENGDIEEYRLIVNSIFPGYLEFDGVQHRTRRLNSVIDFIYHSINELQRNKGTSLSSLDLSPKVESEALEPFVFQYTRIHHKTAYISFKHTYLFLRVKPS